MSAWLAFFDEVYLCFVNMCKLQEASLCLFHSEFQVSEDAQLHKPFCSEGKRLVFLPLRRRQC